MVNGTVSSLIVDNSDGSSLSSTCTPFPEDLSGVQLSQLNISRKACVDLRQAQQNNDVRAICMDLDASSKVTGDNVVIDTSNATVRGQITGTSALWLHNAQLSGRCRSGRGTQWKQHDMFFVRSQDVACRV